MAALVRLVVVTLVCACAHAQYAEERAPRYIASEPKAAPAPPVAILKQINRHNDDGSYTYGYEGADGSFKIETKSPTGEVKGKYGYKDDTGKVRVVEYGANKYGFQPAGEGITVAPPTLVDESTREPTKAQQGRAQYRAQSVDYDYDEPAPTPAPRRPAPRPAPAYRAPQPAPQQYQPAPQQYQPAPQQYQSAPKPQQQYRAAQSAPTPPKPQFFAGAAPVPVEPSQNQGFFNPAPQPRQQQYRPKQDFRPTPQIEYSQDNFAPAQQFTPNFPQQRNSQAPFSMLDQLLKEYSLPQGGSNPTHDITFGSY